MAMLIDSTYSNSSSNGSPKNSSESNKRSNTQASAYVVNASSMALTGFHFSTSGAGGAVLKARKRSGDAAYHIQEECERLFCETLKTVFLVEKDTGLEDSLGVDMRNHSNVKNAIEIPPRPQQHTILKHDLPTPSTSPDAYHYSKTGGLIKEYVEVWDYAGGARFRGFIIEKEGQQSFFILFDKDIIGNDLKPGLMALLELATADGIDCSQLIIGVDRTASKGDVADVTRDLGWVGFDLTMLDGWSGEPGCISDRWILLGMDL